MPATGDLEPTKIDSCLILSTPVLIDDDPTRSVFTEEGMKQVFDIFTADPVDPGVKKSASEQLAIMLKDPHLHALFKSHGGVEIACSVIQQSVMSAAEEADSKQKPDTVAVLPACLSMLHSLARYDYTLRHTLSRDSELYHCLVRVSLLHQSQEQIKSDVSHILTLLLFDEVAKFDIGSVPVVFDSDSGCELVSSVFYVEPVCKILKKVCTC
ncbi:rotatin-like [Aplysia californica]|uniref:Rotatin-like n=1 Tax=Aplysia californica TaxID=6500 RepID=A0ABM1AFH1_APLCA|nr:rotatin-like [Aplysia californica]